MDKIERDFKEKVCSCCRYNNEKECKNTQKTIMNNLIIYRCLNYKRKEGNI